MQTNELSALLAFNLENILPVVEEYGRELLKRRARLKNPKAIVRINRSIVDLSSRDQLARKALAESKNATR